MSLRRIRKYFWRKPRFGAPPSEIVGDDGPRHAEKQAQLLMLAGIARSPDHAARLQDQHGTIWADEIVRLTPRPKPPGAGYRFKLLLKRIEGHNPRDPYRVVNDDKI